MKAILLLPLLAMLSQAAGTTLNFDKDIPGGVPPGFTVGVNSGHKPGKWVVTLDESALSAPHVLVQADAEKSGSRFPVCVVNGFEAKDVDVSVRFKPMQGRKDQAAGLVWRYRDVENYYVVRANALENNVVLYKMEKGKRTDLKPDGAGSRAYGQKIKVPAGEWSALRVLAKADRFEVFFKRGETFHGERPDLSPERKDWSLDQG